MLYSTPDLYFAAYLMASGETLAGTQRDGKRVLFRFEFAAEAEFAELQMAYVNGSGHCSALAMATAAKALKNLIHVV